MKIYDLAAYINAAELIKGRNTNSIYVTNRGVSVPYFSALQEALRCCAESVKEHIPLYARRNAYDLSITYFRVPGRNILVYFADLKSRKVNTTPPPPECYHIHLTTPDPEGEAI